MLIEAKVKVSRIIDAKTKKKTETFILDREFFSQAEYDITALLSQEVEQHTVESFDILSIKVSSVKEIYTEHQGESTFIATFKDIFTDDNGKEKSIRYKILLWANSLSEANHKAYEIAHQGYSMTIEGINEVEYNYLPATNSEESSN